MQVLSLIVRYLSPQPSGKNAAFVMKNGLRVSEPGEIRGSIVLIKGPKDFVGVRAAVESNMVKKLHDIIDTTFMLMFV